MRYNEIMDYNIMFDNVAIIKQCQKHFGNKDPTSLNRWIARHMSSLTSSIRFDGAINVDLKEFETNLVPYPPINSFLCAHSYNGGVDTA